MMRISNRRGGKAILLALMLTALALPRSIYSAECLTGMCVDNLAVGAQPSTYTCNGTCVFWTWVNCTCNAGLGDMVPCGDYMIENCIPSR